MPTLGHSRINIDSISHHVSDWVRTLDASESQGLATYSRHDHAALRKSYKEELLKITQAWLEPPTEALVRSLIKLDDKRDNYREFAIEIDDERIRSDWKTYEIYAREGKVRVPNIPFPLYGEPT